MEYKNITFAIGFPVVVDNQIAVDCFFKENNPPIINRTCGELADIFGMLNISVRTRTFVSEIVTMINDEVFKCGISIALDIPKNVEIDVLTLETIQNAIPTIIKLAIDVQKIHDRRNAINKDLKVLKSSTSAKEEKCD